MEKLIVRDGTELAYVSEGTGRPVIFLHGWTGAALEYWGDILPLIAKAGYRGIALDMRGSGETGESKTKPVKQELWVDDLYDVMEKLDLKDVTVVGSSMGATTLMMFVRKYGNIDRLRAGVFVDQSPCITVQKDGSWDKYAMMGGTYKLEEGLAAYEVMKNDFFEYYKGFAIAMEPKCTEMPKDEFEAYVREMMTHIRVDEQIDLFYDSQFADSRDAIPMFRIPVGYFYADPGALYSTDLANYYKETIPAKVTTVPFPSTNHLFFEDMPDLFAEKLIEFLKDN